jgi:hypothetical protein
MDEEIQMKNVYINSIKLCFTFRVLSLIIVVEFQIKEFLQNYNKITDECFSQCVFTLSHSRLTEDEVCSYESYGTYFCIFKIIL